MLIDLRDYQRAAFDAAREFIRQGKRRVLINAPTGSGKTVLASALMEMVREKGNRANFVVDRLSLIQQTSDTFFRYGLDHGVVQSSHPLYRPSLGIQLCSVQTLSRRGWPESHVDVFDEAHVLHATHKARIEHGGSIVIGLTATPFTKGLGKYFDAVVNVTTTRKLIEDGWLAPYRIFSCAEPDMTGVAVKSTGEWDDTQASKKALEVVGDVVQEYLKHGDGRKFICSAVDTVHVEELQRQFLSAGINVATYTYKDKEDDRAETTAEFRKPGSLIRGLITVTAASRGFDVPDVSCVIMARPLRKSLAEHIQLFGRGLRIAEGKTDCLVLDHSGNCARFFADCEDFFDNGIDGLDDGKPKEKKKAEKAEVEPVKCPSCRALHRPAPFCPVCGHEYPKRAAVQHVPGTLKELIAGGHHRELTRNLWPQVMAYCLERREGDAARRQALAIYRDMTGDWPRAKWENTQPADDISAEVRNRIRAQQIGFAKRRESGRAAA
ncbi:MAG: DEAD/DEAH box helicase [Candidatus Accumulibacter sp.]|nr:DEAD/DEAH box helicase [Accumulibacter sp.]